MDSAAGRKGRGHPGQRARGRGRGRGGGRGRGNITRSEEDVKVSKKLSRMLRHHPPACIDESGWVPLEVVVSSIGSVRDVSQILSVVESDEKGRFQVDLEHNPQRIRATQGHSIELKDPVLTPIKDVSQVAVAVHVTSTEAWQSIREDGFLRKMSRTHIHFATKQVLARKNNWANCMLQLDVQKALDDGIELYLSTNGVLLCEGPVPIHYLKPIDEFPAN